MPGLLWFCNLTAFPVRPAVVARGPVFGLSVPDYSVYQEERYFRADASRRRQGSRKPEFRTNHALVSERFAIVLILKKKKDFVLPDRAGRRCRRNCSEFLVVSVTPIPAPLKAAAFALRLGFGGGKTRRLAVDLSCRSWKYLNLGRR